MDKIKKIWGICNVEIIAGVLFTAAIACCIYDGTYMAAGVSVFIVGILIAFGVYRYRNLTAVVPVHPEFRRRTPPKAKGATKNKGKKFKAKSRAVRTAKKKK